MSAASEESFPFSDLALSRRLEGTEARAGAAFIETRAKLQPESGACRVEVAGAYAVYDGAASPLTQTFGLGLYQKVTGVEMDALEAFFRERGAPVYHEVSPLADAALPVLLSERGYQPFEFTSVMFRPVRLGARETSARNENIRVRLIGDDDVEPWARTMAEGWAEHAEFADQMLDMGRISALRPGGRAFVAEMDGRAVAAGVLSIHDGVALLCGASTIPAARNRGAQLALLEGRLRAAAEEGCDLAMMCALPGSASQRNAERHGFRIAYTRVKWRLRG